MSELTNFDKFDAPCIDFTDLPSGMGEKIQVGDTLVAKCDNDEVSAEVIEVNKDEGKVYLSKELPEDCSDISVKETATGQTARYDAMKKQAQDSSKDAATMPLPNLKKMLIQISIQQGDSNE